MPSKSMAALPSLRIAPVQALSRHAEGGCLARGLREGMEHE